MQTKQDIVEKAVLSSPKAGRSPALRKCLSGAAACASRVAKGCVGCRKELTRGAWGFLVGGK